MNREKLTKEWLEIIKNEWFKNHKAVVNKVNEDLVLIDFDNGTPFYRVRIILDGYMVIITGDIGEAIFRLTEKASIENISRYDMYYFSSKLTTMSRGKDYWDNKIAYSDLKYWALEKYRDCYLENQKNKITEVYIFLRFILQKLVIRSMDIKDT